MHDPDANYWLVTYVRESTLETEERYALNWEDVGEHLVELNRANRPWKVSKVDFGNDLDPPYPPDHPGG